MVSSTLNSSTRTHADIPRGPTPAEFTFIVMLHHDAARCNFYLRSGTGTTRRGGGQLCLFCGLEMILHDGEEKNVPTNRESIRRLRLWL